MYKIYNSKVFGLIFFISSSIYAQVPIQKNLLSCVKEDTLVYLDTLQVHNCLQADRITTDKNKTIISNAVQTIINIGKKQIFVEISEDYFHGPAVDIYDTETSDFISRGSAVIKLHDYSDKPPILHQYPLNPNQSLIFNYLIVNMIVMPLKENTKYTIFMNGDIPYRNQGEAIGYGGSLRIVEENTKKQFLRNSKFENINLK